MFKEPVENCKNCHSDDIIVDHYGDIDGDHYDVCGECLHQNLR